MIVSKIFSFMLPVVLLASRSAAASARGLKLSSESISMLPIHTDTVLATSYIRAYASTTGASQAGTSTSSLPITTSSLSSAITSPLSNIIVTSTQFVISIQTVTVSVPVPTTITATWAPTIPTNSTIPAPTGVTTPTTLTGPPTNSTQATFPFAPTPAACPQDNGTLARPDGVVRHLIQCGIDWAQGNAKYDRGFGESVQYTYEGCSKSCAGDPQKSCRAFVYSDNGTYGIPNCFLRKLGNTTTIARLGFWGGVVFQGANGGSYTLG
ncbi:hypothetical protein B0T18DRAFT_237160 [Schizothecium vesticola]|uniref:Apple domain-containing protein n=1 Tax=Schizothecium vesticola TaxID=314040 RepID=A0AA40BPA7_9PEZI|nr:hypothetical protein B0T18DRAFT_237160 [Schizothecium vesticola]